MEKLIFEYKEENEDYFSDEIIDKDELIKNGINKNLLRNNDIGLPEISEVSLVRHFTNLSEKNFGIDNGFYPLGSCTMKYNPKINEKIATHKKIKFPHPLIEEEYVQGLLKILYEMKNFLKDISGMEEFTFQPAAGAHGEITGLLIIKKYHLIKGNKNKKTIIVPDSSHGTNPASISLAGFNVIEIKSNKDGNIDIDKLEKIVSDDTAGLMLTNPNTLGLFEKDILKISEIIHKVDGLLYYDGANLNPLLGKIKISDMGFDIVHLNLHKSFSTPHGGGGPGAGPVGVTKKLIEFLPAPLISKDNNNKFYLKYNLKNSIGKVHSFYGNINVIIKAYSYILSLGLQNLQKVAENSVLNANYLQKKLKNILKLPYDKKCMHEFVLSGEELLKYGVHTLDIAKRLIDYGYHPPTIYFPLIVKEAIMIEPVETEPKEILDKFAEDFKKIVEEAKNNPELLKEAPHTTEIGRLNETEAARNPILTYDAYLNSK